jgi:hypothetical protein
VGPRVFAHEILFAAIHHSPEACLSGCVVTVKFMPVERHSRFQAQSVSTGQTAEHHSMLGAGCLKVIPESRCQRLGHKEFVAVFPGIPGAGNVEGF